MLRSLDDDFQRDAAVSGHPSDRSDAYGPMPTSSGSRGCSPGSPPGAAGVAGSSSPGSTAVERVPVSDTISPTDSMPTLALLDGHSLAYRFSHCLPTGDAIGPDDQLWRVHPMLLKLVSEHHPDGIAIAWDVGRHLRLAEYPITRQTGAAPRISSAPSFR